MEKRYEDMTKDEKIDYLEDEIGRLTNKIESLKTSWHELQSYLIDPARGYATKWILGKMKQIKNEEGEKCLKRVIKEQ